MTADPAGAGLALAVLGASLAGSVHCVGMCGGIVAAACGGAPGSAGAPPSTLDAMGARSSIPRPGRGLPDRSSGWPSPSALAPHLAYHASRGAAYTALGALAGGLGGLVDLAGAAAGVSRAAALLAGAALLLAGARALLEARGVSLPGLPVARRGLTAIAPPRASLAARLLGAALSRPPAQRAALLGLATGLLPCGWLWAFLATAAGAGGALAGAAVMAAFFAGTLPILAAGGAGAALLARRLGRHAPSLAAIALLVAGAASIGGRLAMAAPRRAAKAQGGTPVPADARASCCGAHAGERSAP